ncbi:MAG: hypothetical protein QOK23_4345 [Gammaproteobacteria bacterium]|jgi:hypothetical protein|nr:hypothetical protein [Gammaproteobacteria bacterium]
MLSSRSEHPCGAGSEPSGSVPHSAFLDEQESRLPLLLQLEPNTQRIAGITG